MECFPKIPFLNPILIDVRRLQDIHEMKYFIPVHST